MGAASLDESRLAFAETLSFALWMEDIDDINQVRDQQPPAPSLTITRVQAWSHMMVQSSLRAAVHDDILGPLKSLSSDLKKKKKSLSLGKSTKVRSTIEDKSAVVITIRFQPELPVDR